MSDMTRDEAKEYIKSVREFYATMEKFAQTKDEAKFGEALDMAIEALQTEPTLCKDCIHWKADNEVFELGFCWRGKNDRPKGEWIDREDSTDMFFLYKYECSACGGKNVFNSSYCPNCGAHMR